MSGSSIQILKQLLHIQYPIVAAPMLGFTTPAMVAAVSSTGGLGSLPIGGLAPAKAAELIKQVKALTTKPFAVNLFAHGPAPAVDEPAVAAMQDFLTEFCGGYDVPYERQDPASFKFHYYRDQVQLLLDEDIPVVSFTFGRLDSEIVATFKAKGIVLIGTATSVAEACLLAQDGVDLISVQGIEAGGHRGTFLNDGPLPQAGLFSLLPQVVDAVNLPLLAAGGIYNGRSMQAAFTLGAAGVQPGSAFLLADESLTAEVHKQAILDSDETSTELTRAFSGRWARGIRNGMMKRVSESGIEIPYYTIQNQLTAKIRAYAREQGIKDLISLWAGQSASNSTRGTTAEIMARLIRELPDGL